MPKGGFWTPDEDARLRKLLEIDTSIEVVAAKLERSVPATKGRAQGWGNRPYGVSLCE